MEYGIKRREVLGMAPAACGLTAWLGLTHGSTVVADNKQERNETLVGFPQQQPDAVRQVVGLSHFNIDRVREIVTERPALARASWDWGFCDWESPIGAASHVGRQDIAELLMEFGATPTIFTFAMLGRLEIVRSMIEAHPGIQKVHGPHGLTLMHHARVGGDRSKAVLAYLAKVGDADDSGIDTEIPEEEQVRLLGTYRYGGQAAELLEVLVEKDELRIKPKGGVARRLVRLEPFVYYPAGASFVRIRFDMSQQVAGKVTIVDGGLTVTATRADG